MNVWIGVILGGAVGSALRYAVSLFMGSKLGPEFPYGTLTVNVTGCLLIGLLYAMGVTVILIIPVVLMAALLGGRLVRRRSQRIAGGVVGAVTVLVGAAGLYALILDLSAVVEVSWPAVVTASALGCWWGPWVMVGRSSR